MGLMISRRVFALVTSLVLFSIIFQVITPTSAADHAPPTSPSSLPLQIERDGTKFVITWDPSAPEIGTARDANLLMLDGSTRPVAMPLTADQLREGRLTYGSFPFNERVKFLLVIRPLVAPPIESTPTASMMVAAIVPREALSSAPANDLATSTGGSNDARDGDSRPPSQSPQPAEASSSDNAASPTNLNVSLAAFQDQVLAPRNAPTSPIPLEPAKTTNLTEKVTEPEASETVPDATTSHLPFERISKPSTADVGQSPQAPQKVGMVTITSDPTGAEVEIDGVPAGKTPLTVRIFPLGLGFTVTVTSGLNRWEVQSIATAEPSLLHAQLK